MHLTAAVLILFLPCNDRKPSLFEIKDLRLMFQYRQPMGRPAVRDDPEFHLPENEGRDAIIWTHDHLYEGFPRLRQSLFWTIAEARLNFVQIYTEERQRQILGHRLLQDPWRCTSIFNIARRLVDERGDNAGHEIEFVDGHGHTVNHVISYWDVPRDAFQEDLGAELIVYAIVCITIIRPGQDNRTIMTLAVDYPPIY